MNRNRYMRRIPIGAEVQPDGGVHFRVWAPKCRKVELVIENNSHNKEVIELEPEGEGYFSQFTFKATTGTQYCFRFDDNDYCYPDPISRYQPDGPHGRSMVIDPDRYHWQDDDWPGVELAKQIIYEMHIGTFTEAGNWVSAKNELKQLAELGITVLEIMPIAEFPGKFGWGYDGVDLFAPTRLYGHPDDLRNFIDVAHSLGLAVILDVVYNHLGPDGNYLKQFSEDYFSKKYQTEWGEALNFDDQNSRQVREYILSNVDYWIREFHFDGLRLDATQQIFDASEKHILAEITETARAAANGRKVIIIAENEPQHVKLVKPPEQGGYGIDGLWNDDFHHSAMVALTGRNEAYYTDYLGKPQEFISAVKYGYLYQGQRYKWQKQRRGTPGFGINPAAFITFIQNHDQVANSAYGHRCHKLTSPGRYRAMTALMILAPGTPMIFQGQEFAASSPFLYFADHNKDLAKLVQSGRQEFLEQFPSLAISEMRAMLADPANPDTFHRCKLDFSEREKHAEIYRLHADLFKLRREDHCFNAQRLNGVDGAVLADEAFVLRFFDRNGDDRILLVNFGTDLILNPAPEPLLAPPEDMEWQQLWSSEDSRYGGCGMPPLETDENWRLPGHAAVVMQPFIKAEKLKS